MSFVLFLGGLFFFSSSVKAELPRFFNIQNLFPVIGSNDLIFMHQSQLSGFVQPEVTNNERPFTKYIRPEMGMLIDYVWKPWVWKENDASKVNILEHRLEATFGATLAISRWLELGLGIPVVLWQRSDALDSLLYHGIGSLSPTATGDFSLSVKIPVLQRQGHKPGWGIAMQTRLFFPTATKKSFAGEAQVTAYPSWVLDYRFRGQVLLSFQAGFHYRPDVSFLNDFVPRSRATLDLGVDVPLPWNKAWSIIGGGYVYIPIAQNKNDVLSWMGSEIILASRFRQPSGFSVTMGGAVGILCGPETPAFRLFVGLAWDIGRTLQTLPPPSIVPPPTQLDPPTITTPSVVKYQGNQPFEDVLFMTDDDGIPPTQVAGLLATASHLKSHPEIRKVVIRGCADVRGTKEYNKKLSGNRAKAVYSFLVENEVLPQRLLTEAAGVCGKNVEPNNEPLLDKNRRVEMIITEQSGSR